MLSNLKKALGLPVDYKTETEKREEIRARNAGWDPETNRPLKPWFKVRKYINRYVHDYLRN